MQCYQVQDKAKSRIGETELMAYFNQKYGLAKLDYKNIEGSKTVIELESVKYSEMMLVEFL